MKPKFTSIMKSKSNNTPRRYKVSSAFIGGGSQESIKWGTEKQARRVAEGDLKDSRVDPETVLVTVQMRTTRWVTERRASVSEVFPDVWKAFVKENAIRNAIDDIPDTGPAFILRMRVRNVVREGRIEDSIESYKREIENCKVIISALETIKAIQEG